MKCLSKDDETRRDEIIADLEGADKEIDDVVTEINKLITEKLNPAIQKYNEVLSDVESFRDDVVNAIDEYMGERSEKWLEGDKGSAYSDWKSEWENFDTAAIEPVEELEAPNPDHRNDLEGLPSEPGGL